MEKEAVKEAVIKAKHGLHVRPLSTFVREAKKFQSELKVETDGKFADAKSLMKLAGLELSLGKTLKVHAKGPDADDAADTLAKLIESINE